MMFVVRRRELRELKRRNDTLFDAWVQATKRYEEAEMRSHKAEMRLRQAELEHGEYRDSVVSRLNEGP